MLLSFVKNFSLMLPLGTKAPSQTNQPPPTVPGGTPVLLRWIKSYEKDTLVTAKVHKTPLC